MTGGERMILRLLRGTASSVYTPILVTQRRGPLAIAAEDEGIITIVVPLPVRLDQYDGAILRYSLLDKISAVFDLAIYNYQLNKIINGYKIRLVWCSNIRALLTIALLTRLRRIPVIWNIWLARKFGRWTGLIYGFSFFLANRIVTEYYRQSSTLFYGWERNLLVDKVMTVYTGLEVERFVKPIGTPADIQVELAEMYTIVSCGRITPRKGFEYLIEAATILRSRNRRILVKIVGDALSNDDRAYLRDLKHRVATRSLEDVVAFLGWHDDVRPILEAADVYVSSSLDEGLPGAVREAQAMGKPVIATDVGGTAEAIANGRSGHLVSSGDPNALADAIDGLIINSQLAREMGKYGRQRVSSLFGIEKFIANYLRVFDSCFQKNCSSALTFPLE